MMYPQSVATYSCCMSAVQQACSCAGSRCPTFLGGGFALLLRLPIELPQAPPLLWLWFLELLPLW